MKEYNLFEELGPGESRDGDLVGFFARDLCKLVPEDACQGAGGR